MAYKKHHMSRKKSRRKQSKRIKRTRRKQSKRIKRIKSKTRKLRGGTWEDDIKLTVPKLKAELEARRLPVDGLTAVLLARLLDAGEADN